MLNDYDCVLSMHKKYLKKSIAKRYDQAGNMSVEKSTLRYSQILGSSCCILILCIVDERSIFYLLKYQIGLLPLITGLKPVLNPKLLRII